MCCYQLLIKRLLPGTKPLVKIKKFESASYKKKTLLEIQKIIKMILNNYAMTDFFKVTKKSITKQLYPQAYLNQLRNR